MSGSKLVHEVARCVSVAPIIERYIEVRSGAEQMQLDLFFDTYAQALDANYGKRRRLVDTSLVAYANLTSSWHLLYPPEVVAQADQHFHVLTTSATDIHHP